jgi:hypothetical protein
MPPRRPGHNRSQSLPFRPRVEGSGGWRVIAQIFEGLPFCHTQRKGAANRRYTLPRKARHKRNLKSGTFLQSLLTSQTELHTFNDLPGHRANTGLYFSRQAGRVQDTRLCIYESIAKRLFHRRDAAFAEEDATASRSNASCFATHTFRFLDSLYARRLSGASLLVKSYMVQVRERTGCTYDASPGWRPRAVNSAPSFCSPRRTRVLIVPSGRFSFVAISWCDNPPKYASSTASRCVSGR